MRKISLVATVTFVEIRTRSTWTLTTLKAFTYTIKRIRLEVHEARAVIASVSTLVKVFTAPSQTVHNAFNAWRVQVERAFNPTLHAHVYPVALVAATPLLGDQ